jgi:hypothetical protein
LQITLPDGKKVEAVEVGITKSTENWNEYELEDGSTMKVKLVLLKVLKTTTEKTPLGEPIYITNAQNLMVVKAKKE